MSDNRQVEANYELSKYNSHTAVINKAYCDKNGYDFIYYVPHLNESTDVYNCLNPITGNTRHASWSKLLSTKKALQLDYDYVVYIDSDCIFKNFDKKLEYYIESNNNKSLIFLNDKPWSVDKPCAGFYICKSCPETLGIINDWYLSSEFPHKDKEHAWEQVSLHSFYKTLSIGIADEWMFKEVNGQFLRHIGSYEDKHFKNRGLYFKKFIDDNKISYLIDKIHVERFNTYEIYPNSFNVLIATVGRPTLQNMLDSLSPQLSPKDCLTLVFDGHSKIPLEFNFSNFKCKVVKFCEPIALGYWGHGIRNKYAALIKKRDFIMHADDDDMYDPDAFKVVRNICIDRSTLYVFKMKLSESFVFPEKHTVRENNIGTPLGVIPYELNNKGVWLYRYGGDGSFYEQIAHQNKNIIYSNFPFYNVRPHAWKKPQPVIVSNSKLLEETGKQLAKQIKFFGGKLNLL